MRGLTGRLVAIALMSMLWLPVGCASLARAGSASSTALPAIQSIATPEAATKAFFFGVEVVKTSVDAAQRQHASGIIHDSAWAKILTDEAAFKKGALLVNDGITIWVTKGDPTAFIKAYADWSTLFNAITGGK
jgi:hypothetical protein